MAKFMAHVTSSFCLGAGAGHLLDPATKLAGAMLLLAAVLGFVLAHAVDAISKALSSEVTP